MICPLSKNNRVPYLKIKNSMNVHLFIEVKDLDIR